MIDKSLWSQYLFFKVYLGKWLIKKNTNLKILKNTILIVRKRVISMLSLTENAKKYVLDNSPISGAPLNILIKEIEYRSWCGVRQVIQVDLVESIPNSSKISDVTPNGEQIKIFAESRLQQSISDKKIDLIGWSYYQRLALV